MPRSKNVARLILGRGDWPRSPAFRGEWRGRFGEPPYLGIAVAFRSTRKRGSQ